MSARERIAPATKPSSPPIILLDRPEDSNATSETSGSIPESGNVDTGNQIPDSPGRLASPNRSQFGPFQQPSSLPFADEAKLIACAESLMKRFDFVGAGLLLEYAVDKGSARVAFTMAETYDWQILRSMQVYDLRGDDQKAVRFYRLAVAGGIEKAWERLETLTSDVSVGPDLREQRNTK
jgi:hypothetical protein